MNTGDRPVQVGSHYHFAEANPALLFDRAAARGHRLDIPAGTSVRFEPGIARTVDARAVGGDRVDRRSARRGRSGTPRWSEIDRAGSHYRRLYGPTAGDRIRLADTDLLIEVERDLCAGGDEAVFGGGKVIRESMGQSARTRAQGTPDLVITGAVILDHWGVVKADVGVRDGRIVGIGKAGNPDTMDGVDPTLVIGPSTEILAGNGKILTAGAIDCHVHLICPQIVDEALASGITTIIGGGTGPGRGHEGHHGHAGRLVPGPHARGDGRHGRSTSRCSARATRCRTKGCGSSCSAAPAASSCTRTGARRRPPSTPA